jgi:4-amino-4-deoxy-L-arabinose transferase-like glycosyltransferase
MSHSTTLRPLTKRWLVLVLIAGCCLRVYGIWFGLPYLLARPDEDVAAGRAAAMLSTGDANPHFFHWPSLTFYLFAAAYAIAGAAKALFSSDSALTAAEQIVIARCVVAGAGTATIFVVFRMGCRVAGETTGLLAAALMAVATLHVRESHFAMTDVLMTFLVTSSLALLLRAVDEDGKRSRQSFAAAGILGGLAASTKYSAVAIVAPLVVIFFARTSRSFLAREAWLPSMAFGGMLLVGFIATTPYAVLDYSAFVNGFRFTFAHLAAGQNVILGRGWMYHATHSLPFGMGIIAFPAAIVGAFIAARDYRRHVVVLASFAVLLYLSIGSGYLVFHRYVLPLLPTACLFAAIAVRRGAMWLSRRANAGYPALLGLLAALTLVPGLVNSVWLDILLARADSRVVAAQWLERRIAPFDMVYDAGGRYVALDLSSVTIRRLTFDDASGSFKPVGQGSPAWLILYESPLSAYTATPAAVERLAGRDYVLAHTVPGTRRASAAVYDRQDLFFLPVWGLWAVDRPGPTVHIYRKKDRP